MSEKLNKVIILGPAWPFRGGLSSYNQRLAEEFIAKGIDCEMITFTTQYPNILFPGKTQYSEESSSFSAIKRKLSSINPISWVRTANYINQQKPDMVMVRFWLPFMGPSFGTVLRLLNKKIKIICLLDNVIPHEKRIGDTPFTKYFLKPIHHFIAMSRSVEEDLYKFAPDATCIFNPHPLFDNFGEAIDENFAKKELGLAEEDEFVLFFGFIRKYKGLDLALKSVAEWKKKLPHVKLLVAGEFYQDESSYKNLVKELSIEENVIWHTEFIPDSKVKYYFSAAKLVLQPYHHATQSGVTQIAFQFEKPMIVTKVGGLPELINHQKTGYLADHDEKQIANFVVSFFTKERAEILKNMSEAKKRFSWGRMVEQIELLYKM